MDPQDWECTCGMINNGLLPYCEMCNSPRQIHPLYTPRDFFSTPLSYFGGIRTRRPYPSMISRSANANLNMLAAVMRLMSNDQEDDPYTRIMSSIFSPGISTGGLLGGDFQEQQFQHILEMLRQRETTPKKPTSKQALEKLELIHITDENLEKYKSESCSICLCNFEKGDSVTEMPACKHLFHYTGTKDPDKEGNCLATWLKDHNTCPVCRSELPSETPSTIPQPQPAAAPSPAPVPAPASAPAPTATSETGSGSGGSGTGTGTGYNRVIRLLAIRFGLSQDRINQISQEVNNSSIDLLTVLNNRNRFTDDQINQVKTATGANESQVILSLTQTYGNTEAAIRRILE